MKRVVVFDIVSHLGGAQLSTAEFMARIGKVHDTSYVDGCGSIPEHLALLAELRVRYDLLSPGSRMQILPPRTNRLARASALPDLIRVCTRFRGFLRAVDPDLVVVISPKAAVVAAVAGVGVRARLLYWCRGSHIPPTVARYPWAGRIDSYAVLSERVMAESVARGVPRERIGIIPNAVDPAAIRAAAACPAEAPLPAAAGPVILVPATLLPAKGQEWAIRALAELPRSLHAELWLAGDEGGETTGYRSDLERIAREAGVADALRFLGPRNDLLSVMRGCEVVALPSHSEGAPRVVMEACALGIPVVGSRVGAIPELLEDGAGGWLVGRGEAGALGRALHQALTDQPMRRAKAARARAHIETFCAPERQMLAFSHALARTERRRA